MTANALFSMLVFPGFLFLAFFGFALEYVDRKFHARMQNRVGPPWFQPLADFIKLAAKEAIVPAEPSLALFQLLPVFAVTAVVTASLYIPIWGTQALASFNGDLVVVLYLLTIPTLTFFLAGWHSLSPFSVMGAIRSLTQFFAYEIPLLISLMAPALLAGTWSLSGITLFYSIHPWHCAANILGFCVAMVTLLGKLEKVPFDIPEAETEIVGGSFNEYSGRLLALFRLSISLELVVCAALLSAIFLPFGLGLGPVWGFALFLAKVLLIVGLISVLRTIFARLRIDQMMEFCWKYVAPLSLLQVFINLILVRTLP